MSMSKISPAELQRRLQEDSAVLIDIREAGEYAREHIQGARLVPLSAIDTAPRKWLCVRMSIAPASCSGFPSRCPRIWR